MMDVESWTLVKDSIQILAWMAAIGFGLHAAYRANRQRSSELRWRQAKATIDMVDEMWADEHAGAGLRMISHHKAGKFFSVDESHKIYVNAKDLLTALGKPWPPDDEGSEFICYCLEHVFDYMAKMHHCIEADLISSTDIKYHMNYYVRIMAMYKDELTAFMAADYKETIQFLERFEDWRKPPIDAVSGSSKPPMTTGQVDPASGPLREVPA